MMGRKYSWRSQNPCLPVEVPPGPSSSARGTDRLVPRHHRALRGVSLGGVRTKPGPTRGTIAINRIYFVQLLPTYTQPRGFQNGCRGRKDGLWRGA